jgi:hypothetical protein
VGEGGASVHLPLQLVFQGNVFSDFLVRLADRLLEILALNRACLPRGLKIHIEPQIHLDNFALLRVGCCGLKQEVRSQVFIRQIESPY